MLSRSEPNTAGSGSAGLQIDANHNLMSFFTPNIYFAEPVFRSGPAKCGYLQHNVDTQLFLPEGFSRPEQNQKPVQPLFALHIQWEDVRDQW